MSDSIDNLSDAASDQPPLAVEPTNNEPTVAFPVGIQERLGPSLAVARRQKAKPKRISEKAVKNALKKAGMPAIEPAMIRAAAIVGAFVKQEGAIKTARANLVFTEDQLKRGVIQCDEAIACEVDPKRKALLIRVKLDFIHELNRHAEIMMKSAQIDATDGADAAQSIVPFGIGQVVIPQTNTQVNIDVQAKTPEPNA